MGVGVGDGVAVGVGVGVDVGMASGTKDSVPLRTRSFTTGRNTGLRSILLTTDVSASKSKVTMAAQPVLTRERVGRIMVLQ